MWEEIIQKVQASVQGDMAQRFGLTEEQAKESGNVVLENLRKVFSDDFLNKDLDLNALIRDFNDPQKNPLLQKLNSGLFTDLVEKAKLSPEMADRVKDFSGKELLNTIKEKFLDENGKPDMAKIMQSVDMKQMQLIARGLLGKLGGLFEK